MGAECDWNESGGGPSKKVRQRCSEKFPCPSKGRRNVGAFSANLGDPLRGKRAGEEQREQKERDAPELAPEC
jgi:hypothetical protein